MSIRAISIGARFDPDAGPLQQRLRDVEVHGRRILGIERQAGTARARRVGVDAQADAFRR